MVSGSYPRLQVVGRPPARRRARSESPVPPPRMSNTRNRERSVASDLPETEDRGEYRRPRAKAGPVPVTGPNWRARRSAHLARAPFEEDRYESERQVEATTKARHYDEQAGRYEATERRPADPDLQQNAERMSRVTDQLSFGQGLRRRGQEDSEFNHPPPADGGWPLGDVASAEAPSFWKFVKWEETEEKSKA